MKFECRNNVCSVCYWKKILDYFNSIEIFNTLMQMVISSEIHKLFVLFNDQDEKMEELGRALKNIQQGMLRNTSSLVKDSVGRLPRFSIACLTRIRY